MFYIIYLGLLTKNDLNLGANVSLFLMKKNINEFDLIKQDLRFLKADEFQL